MNTVMVSLQAHQTVSIRRPKLTSAQRDIIIDFGTSATSDNTGSDPLQLARQMASLGIALVSKAFSP